MAFRGWIVSGVVFLLRILSMRYQHSNSATTLLPHQGTIRMLSSISFLCPLNVPYNTTTPIELVKHGVPQDEGQVGKPLKSSMEVLLC